MNNVMDEGELTMTSAQRPAPSATSNLTRRPRTESRPAPAGLLAWPLRSPSSASWRRSPRSRPRRRRRSRWSATPANRPASDTRPVSGCGRPRAAVRDRVEHVWLHADESRVPVNDAQSHTFSAQFCEANNAGGDAVPDPMNCQTLSTTSSFAQSSVVVFTPPAGMTITLAASTRYVVVLSENNSPSAVVDILSTQANNQNGATGWTLANVFDWKQNGTTWMKQGSGRDALIMDVKGYVNTSLPAAVSDVVVVPVRRTTDSLTISWSAPNNTGKPALTGYEFRYKADLVDAVWTLVSHPGASTSVTVNGLDDDRLYFVEVRALNADGSGPWSVTAECQTSPPPQNGSCQPPAGPRRPRPRRLLPPSARHERHDGCHRHGDHRLPRRRRRRRFSPREYRQTPRSVV